MRTYKDDFKNTGVNCLSLDSLNEAADNLLTQIPNLPACNAATIGFIDLDLNCWVPDLEHKSSGLDQNDLAAICREYTKPSRYLTAKFPISLAWICRTHT